MVEGTADKYLAAKAEFEEAKQKVEVVAEKVVDIGNILQHEPLSLGISNVNVPLPLGANAEHSLNSDEWPNAKQIAELLKAMHDANKKVRALYASLPEAYRKNLSPPDSTPRTAPPPRP